jgi:phospho-N-acetylmuramoyl-pentapeptide-transferase
MITALVFVFMFVPGSIDHQRIRQGKGQPIRTDDEIAPPEHQDRYARPWAG